MIIYNGESGFWSAYTGTGGVVNLSNEVELINEIVKRGISIDVVFDGFPFIFHGSGVTHTYASPVRLGENLNFWFYGQNTAGHLWITLIDVNDNWLIASVAENWAGYRYLSFNTAQFADYVVPVPPFDWSVVSTINLQTDVITDPARPRHLAFMRTMSRRARGHTATNGWNRHTSDIQTNTNQRIFSSSSFSHVQGN